MDIWIPKRRALTGVMRTPSPSETRHKGIAGRFYDKKRKPQQQGQARDAVNSMIQPEFPDDAFPDQAGEVPSGVGGRKDQQHQREQDVAQGFKERRRLPACMEGEERLQHQRDNEPEMKKRPAPGQETACPGLFQKLGARPLRRIRGLLQAHRPQIQEAQDHQDQQKVNKHDGW